MGTQLLNNHFNNRHGRKGKESEMLTDIEAVGRMGGLVAQEIEKVDENYRKLVHGESIKKAEENQGNNATNESTPNNQAQDNPLLQPPQPAPKPEEKEGEISSYFMNVFNDLNNEEDDEEEKKPEDTEMKDAEEIDKMDINENPIHNEEVQNEPIAAKLGANAEAAGGDENSRGDPELEKRLALDMNFIVQNTNPPEEPGAEVEKRLAKEIDSIAQGIAAQK